MKTLVVKIPFFLFFCLIQSAAFSQNVLTKGSPVQNIPIKKLLNHTASITSFKDLQSRITIVDFFGTWCGPCLRALPRLTDIKGKYGNDVSIILVSNETEAQLTKFIKGRNNFSFPVIVDEGNLWNALFQPPALPYTVVVKDGKVLDVTTAEGITDAAMQKWLDGSETPAPAKETQSQGRKALTMSYKKSSNQIVQLSQEYIYAAKTGDQVVQFADQLKKISYQQLRNTLGSDNAKKAFWINLYNGYTQAALQSNPALYQKRNSFFKTKIINVARSLYSLDDIEHGILRRSKIKWSLGHLNKLFPAKKERQLRADTLDYRIHFALNCGAKSCPPIAFYTDESLDAQLDLATRAYLNSEAEYDSSANVLTLPKLMSWFRADFGGKKGMIQILKDHGLIPSDSHPKIKFKDYDWTLALNNYTNQNP